MYIQAINHLLSTATKAIISSRMLGCVVCPIVYGSTYLATTFYFCAYWVVAKARVSCISIRTARAGASACKDVGYDVIDRSSPIKRAGSHEERNKYSSEVCGDLGVGCWALYCQPLRWWAAGV